MQKLSVVWRQVDNSNYIAYSYVADYKHVMASVSIRPVPTGEVITKANFRWAPGRGRQVDVSETFEGAAAEVAKVWLEGIITAYYSPDLVEFSEEQTNERNKNNET